MKKLMSILLLLMLSVSAHAEIIKLKTETGLVVTADYLKGDADKPAVFLVHGFLQTGGSYQTIQTLKSELNDAGYTVLAPTLSLGINDRKRSLECEAIHTHTIEQDTSEIDMWMTWLHGKHKNINVVGHSFGNVNILAYLTSGKRPVNKFIAISIVSFKKQAYDEQLPLVRADMQEDPNKLHDYRLSFCKKYVAPAKTVLTYLNWTNDKIITNLKTTNSAYPTYVVVGSKDKRITPDWLVGIKSSKSRILTIDGANHFFSGEHEFDVVDTVVSVIEGK